MENFKIIDCLLDADKRIQEGYEEIKMTGSNKYCDALIEFIPLTVTPTIFNLFNAMRESDKSESTKVFALEALSCDLSLIAIELGFVYEGSK